MMRMAGAIALLWLAAATGAAAQVPEAQQHRAWLNQYCVSCHNSRTSQPSNDPVNLETVNVNIANAGTGVDKDELAAAIRSQVVKTLDEH